MLDVIVLNAYHRGDWLAQQFKSRDHAVEVLDISAVVGPRDSADLAGPFGFFSGSNAGLEEWFLQNRQSQVQANGWCLWTELGTLESVGMINVHQARQNPATYHNILKSWFAGIDRPAIFLTGQRPPTSTTGAMLLEKDFAAPSDVRRTVKAGDTFEYSTAPGKKTVRWNEQTFDSHFVISFLTPHEAMAGAATGLSKLLTGEALRPRLCWQRCRVKLATALRLASLPEHFMFLNKLNDPWHEENFLVIRKTGEAGIFDIWYRTWFEVHRDAAYFKGLAEKIQSVLRTRFPDLKMQTLAAPVETTAENLFSLYPVYDLQEWTLQTKWFDNGIYSAGYEKSENFSLASQIDLQMQILKHLDEEHKSG